MTSSLGRARSRRGVAAGVAVLISVALGGCSFGPPPPVAPDVDTCELVSMFDVYDTTGLNVHFGAHDSSPLVGTSTACFWNETYEYTGVIPPAYASLDIVSMDDYDRDDGKSLVRVGVDTFEIQSYSDAPGFDDERVLVPVPSRQLALVAFVHVARAPSSDVGLAEALLRLARSRLVDDQPVTRPS